MHIISRVFLLCMLSISSLVFAQEAAIPPMQPLIPPASSIPPMSNKYFRTGPQWYLDFSGSVNYPQDARLSGGASGEVSHDSGYGFSAALGYKPPFARGFFSQTRFELEGGYRTADLERDGVSPSGTSGDLKAWSMMMNSYFDLKNASVFTPYVGLGVGLTRLSFNAPRLGVDDNDTVPAYQLLAGVSYEPEALPRTGFHLGYRYLNSFSDPSYANASGVKIKSEYSNHSVEGGVRLHF